MYIVCISIHTYVQANLKSPHIKKGGIRKKKNVKSLDVDNPFAQWDIHNIHDCLTNNNKNVSINLNWNWSVQPLASTHTIFNELLSHSRKFYGNFVDNNFLFPFKFFHCYFLGKFYFVLWKKKNLSSIGRLN